MNPNVLMEKGAQNIEVGHLFFTIEKQIKNIDQNQFCFQGLLVNRASRILT